MVKKVAELDAFFPFSPFYAYMQLDQSSSWFITALEQSPKYVGS
jgi:hypothetical protein